VLIVGPDARTKGAWPTFTADAARALMRADVPFAVARAPELSPSHADEAYNAFFCTQFADFLSTGEISRPEAIVAALLALVSRGRFDRRIHPHTAALLGLAELGRVLRYSDVGRAKMGAERVRAAAEEAWSRGFLLVAPMSTSPPPRHGRALRDVLLQSFCKLGNLVDATGVAIPFGWFDGGRLPRSLQIMGPPGSEEAVLDLAERLEVLSGLEL
jgi:Asp-tRNA(Asn)/Glu-tRNA(Gln) amidotransferase A subunit family amidase